MGANTSTQTTGADCCPAKDKYTKDDLTRMIASGIVHNDYGPGDSFTASFVDDWNKSSVPNKKSSKLKLNDLLQVKFNLYHASDRKRYGHLRFMVVPAKKMARVIVKKGNKQTNYSVKL